MTSDVADIKKSDTDIVGQQKVGFGSVRIGNTESRIRIPKKSDILSDIGYLKIQTFLDSILTFYCIFSHKFFTVTNHSTKICKILLFLEKRKKIFFFKKFELKLKGAKNMQFSPKICNFRPKFDSRIFVGQYSRTRFGSDMYLTSKIRIRKP